MAADESERLQVVGISDLVPLWFVYTDPAHPGQVEARAYVGTHAGGELLGTLTTASLDELRAMLPAALTRRERAPIDPPDVVEMWE